MVGDEDHRHAESEQHDRRQRLARGEHQRGGQRRARSGRPSGSPPRSRSPRQAMQGAGRRPARSRRRASRPRRARPAPARPPCHGSSATICRATGSPCGPNRRRLAYSILSAKRGPSRNRKNKVTSVKPNWMARCTSAAPRSRPMRSALPRPTRPNSARAASGSARLACHHADRLVVQHGRRSSQPGAAMPSLRSCAPTPPRPPPRG